MTILSPPRRFIILALCALMPATLGFGADGSDEASSVVPHDVLVLLYEGVELLDMAGPSEVLEVASHLAVARGLPALEIRYVAASLDPVATSHGPRVQPTVTLEAVDPPDVLVVPGRATAAVTGDSSALRLIRRTAAEGLVLTVCNAALIVADLALLAGRRATTHHGSLASLARREGVTAVRGVRFLDSGSVITSGGVSSGIDGALHVVQRLYGEELAESVASYLQYPWPADAAPEVVEAETLSPATRAIHLFEGAAGQVLDSDLELALRWLRASFEAGHPSPRDALTRPEFRPLLDRPETRERLQRLVEEFSSD